MARSIKLDDNTYIDGVGVWDSITHTDLKTIVESNGLLGMFPPNQMNFSNTPPAQYGRCIIPLRYQYNYKNRIVDSNDYYMLFITSSKTLYVGFSASNARYGGNWDVSWQQV